MHRVAVIVVVEAGNVQRQFGYELYELISALAPAVPVMVTVISVATELNPASSSSSNNNDAPASITNVPL